MSVVVGCSYPGGVVLVCDARVSVNGVFVDRIQKIVPLTPDSAIAFVGDIDAASRLLRGAQDALPRRFKCRPPNALELLHWIPRFLRRRYASDCRADSAPLVQFMVASALRGRPNVIRTSRLIDLFKRHMPKKNGQSGSMSGNFGCLLGQGHVTATIGWHFPYCMLYVMSSPEFQPQLVEPLSFAVIGMTPPEREALAKAIEERETHLLCEVSGNPNLETHSLAELVGRFVDRRSPKGVGGLYPSVRVDEAGVTLFGHRTEFLRGTTAIIELTPTRESRWTQRNVSTGKEAPLVAPWGENWRKHLASQTFDDLQSANRVSIGPQRFNAIAFVDGCRPQSLVDGEHGTYVMIDGVLSAPAEKFLLVGA